VQVKASQTITEDYSMNSVLFLILFSNFECEYLDDGFFKRYSEILIGGNIKAYFSNSRHVKVLLLSCTSSFFVKMRKAHSRKIKVKKLKDEIAKIGNSLIGTNLTA
jgi:hypothetical protein